MDIKSGLAAPWFCSFFIVCSLLWCININLKIKYSKKILKQVLCILCYFLFSTENKQPTVKTPALHYLVELLSGHIGPQEALNGDSCRALLLEASPGNPHANILLNGEGGSGSSQQVDVADRGNTTRYIRKPHTVIYGIPSLLLPPLTFVPDDPGRISVW